jgi:hypothetical protein
VESVDPTPSAETRSGAQVQASLAFRLLMPIGQILKINDPSIITEDVMEAARSTLVIGVN